MKASIDNSDVKAVIAEAPCIRHPMYPDLVLQCESGWDKKHPECALAALTAENYAIVKLPEGVAVAHGARLVPWSRRRAMDREPFYAIEAMP